MRTNKLLRLVFQIAVTILTQTFVKAQTFDFQNKTLDTNEVSNKNFTFKVNYINTFKYDVYIDNKPVKYNIEVPSLLNSALNNNGIAMILPQIKVIDEIHLKDAMMIRNEVDSFYIEICDFTYLKGKYLELLTVEQFYNSLKDLVNSDISPIEIVETKTDFFNQYLPEKFRIEESATAKIIQYYYTISNQILTTAPTVLINDTTKTNEIQKIVNKTTEINETKIIYSLASLYSSINKEAFCVSSFIERPDADEVIINISAKPKPGNIKDKEINLKIPIMIEGGWKIDFSSGMFVSNLIDNIHINKPQFRNDSIVGYKLVPENSNPISYGFCGFMHAYSRSKNECKIGITMGIGIDQNIQTKVMFGGSLILGKKERFIINTGVALSKIKELSNTYYTDHLYKDRVDITYSEPFKVGLFFGISYNISK